jgi:hypothetical protein
MSSQRKLLGHNFCRLWSTDGSYGLVTFIGYGRPVKVKKICLKKTESDTASMQIFTELTNITESPRVVSQSLQHKNQSQSLQHNNQSSSVVVVWVVGVAATTSRCVVELVPL